MGSGPAIHLPIFDAGKIKAQYANATADLDASVADYNGAVVNAIKQTADAMTQVKSLAAQRAQQEAAVRERRARFQDHQDRYRGGLATQLPMLTAESTLLQARQALAGVNGAAAQQRITLMLTVGGTYDPEQQLFPTCQGFQAMTDTTQRPGRQRRFWFLILGAVVLIGAVAYGVYWLLYSRYFESTDDAYVAGNVVTITSEENATVLALHADNTQTVKQGQLLVEMDPAVATVNLQASEANLARVVRTVRAQFSRTDASDAELNQARVNLAQAQGDYERRQKAFSTEAVRPRNWPMPAMRSPPPRPRCAPPKAACISRAPPSRAPTSPTIPTCCRRKPSCAPRPSPTAICASSRRWTASSPSARCRPASRWRRAHR